MKRNAIIPLVLGLTIGLVAVKFGVDAIRRAKASGGTTITAVRAKVDINSFEQIKPEMVEPVDTVDSQFAPASERISDVAKAIGRVTAKSVPKGSPVLMSMLAPEGTKEGMVGRIPAGFRGISVKIDEATGVAYHLKVGDWVDVSVVMDVESGLRGKKDVISEVLLQHVQVAAVGYGQEGGGTESAKAMKPAKSATLLVAEDEVPKLHLAMTRGKVSLALRGDDDSVQKKSTVAFESEMGAGKGTDSKPEPTKSAKEAPAPPPAKPVAPKVAAKDMPFQVSVYRRTPIKETQTIEQITFQNQNSPRILSVSLGLPTRASAAISGVRPGAAPRARPADHNAWDQGFDSNTPPADDSVDSDEGETRPQE